MKEEHGHRDLSRKSPPSRSRRVNGAKYLHYYDHTFGEYRRFG